MASCWVGAFRAPVWMAPALALAAALVKAQAWVSAALVKAQAWGESEAQDSQA